MTDKATALVEAALRTTHKIISEFAISGFTDPEIGERLFLNQGNIVAALKLTDEGEL